LPLVSTALLETWVHRSAGTLTMAGYVEAGGVRGAVGRLAEMVYEGFDSAGRAAARRILLRLTDPEEDRSDIRRSAQPAELASTAGEHAVLMELIDRRLVTTSTDGTVEVAHEALLREWPRLRGWLEDDRDGRRLHRRLADAAIAWQADQRDESGLYRGVRLAAARDWAGSHGGDANRLEREFLAASQAAQDDALHADERAAHRRRVLLGGVAALLVLATAAGVLAATQRSAAGRQAALARRHALKATLSRLVELAQTLPPSQRDLALLLGAQSFHMQPSNETAAGLQTALVQTPPELDRIIRYQSATYIPHLDHDGRLLAVAGTAGVTVDDLVTGTVAQTMRWPHPREFAVFSGDDSLVAAGGFDGQIAIWDTATGQPSGTPLVVGGRISYAVFDPTNRNRVYAVTDTGVLTTWDRRDPKHPHQVTAPRTFEGGADANNNSTPSISPDGRLLAAGNPFTGPATVWDLTSGREVSTFTGALGAFGADGVTLPIGLGDRTVLYNARTGRQLATIPNPGGAWPNAVLSRDGRRIAETLQVQRAFEVQVYDIATGQPLGAPLRLHDNAAIPIGFLPDGRLVTSGNNEAAIWKIGRSLPPLAVPLPAVQADTNYSVFLPRTDDVITVGEQTNLLFRHNPTTGARLNATLDGNVHAPIAPNPQGTLIAAADARTGDIGIWDETTSHRLAVLPRAATTEKLSWSLDGNHLATSAGHDIKLWNLINPRHPRHTASLSDGALHPDDLLYSPDGRHLLAADTANNRLTVFNIGDRDVQWTRTETDLTLFQAGYSPDGTTIAVDSGDSGKGQLTLYNSTTGASTNTVSTPSAGGIAYLHAGRWLVVTSGVSNPGAQLYDAQTLQPIGVPFPINSVAGPIAANQQGTLFSEAEQDAPLLWDADPARWATLACTIADRNLTKAEWRQYLSDYPYQITCPEWPTGQ
jgi:WD40 repeat protein